MYLWIMYRIKEHDYYSAEANLILVFLKMYFFQKPKPTASSSSFYVTLAEHSKGTHLANSSANLYL